MSEYGAIPDLPHTQAANVAVVRIRGLWRGYGLAGWWKRMTAAVINYMGPVAIALVLTGGGRGGAAGQNIAFVIWLGGVIVAVGVNPWGIDFGKTALRITTVRAVVGPNGPAFTLPSPGWRLVRLVAHVFDMFWCIGIFLVAFRWNKRSIADSVAGTVVIDYRPNEVPLLPTEPFPGHMPRDRF